MKERQVTGKEGHRVLIVDDGPENISLLTLVLTRAGYEVLAAGSGREALEIVESTVPDAFLLDIMMPEMDGYELCRRLKEQERLADIPVIFLTAMDSSDKIVKGLEAGAVDYVTKPFSHAEILARIRTHIRLHEALLEIERLRQLALDANPLTQLPGNNTINRTIQEAIDRRAELAVIYCDLDNFKAYNDRYGFSAGDGVLQFTAGVLRDTCRDTCEKDGFIGHIGGDDFVLLVPADRVTDIGEEIARRFDAGIAEFYEDEDRERRYIETTSRQGEVMKFPFMSISMAGVDLSASQFTDFREVSATCAELKKKAKQTAGSVIFLDRRSTGSTVG
jgi:diguanylate cyclase (GGDEF)-like protein